jgi:hypothetical protein
MLPQSRMQVINNEECIVIPRHANPSIYMVHTQSGQTKALLDIFIRATQNSQYGNTHFVKANVGKSNREKYRISKDELGKYSPILGNLKPYAPVSKPVVDDDDLPEGEFKGF